MTTTPSPDTHFVNPYFFVPQPSGGVRRQPPPALDRQSAETLSGVIEYEIKAATPISVGSRQGKPEQLRGSHLHGAVRSLFEALTESCYRVFDAAYSPAYREPLQPREHWGVVTKTDQTEGRLRLWVTPAEPRDCMVVRAQALSQQAGKRPVRTGMRLALSNPEPAPPRTILRARGVRFDKQGDHYLLVTDTGARSKSTEFRAVKPSGGEIEIPREVLARFERAREGTNDVRTHARTWVPVRIKAPKDVVISARFERRSASSPFFVGQPIRIDWEGEPRRSGVLGIALSETWRSVVDTRSGDLLEGGEDSCQPCHTSDALCPACRLFGSADTDTIAGRSASADQQSVRGRVRFLDPARVVDAGFIVREAQLMSPRPSSGHFYLTPSGDQRGDVRPWASSHETRRLRGRKMYWNGAWDDRKAATRSTSAGAQQASRTASILAAHDIGTTWQGRVTFESLTEPELGALLCALAPGLLGAEARLPLGGGKPVGMGAADVRIRSLSERSTSRWVSDQGQVEPDLNRLVTAFRREFAHAEATWTMVARLLSPQSSEFSALVAYPQSQGIRPGEPGDALTFWKQWVGKPGSQQPVRPGLPTDAERPFMDKPPAKRPVGGRGRPSGSGQSGGFSRGQGRRGPGRPREGRA